MNSRSATVGALYGAVNKFGNQIHFAGEGASKYGDCFNDVSSLKPVFGAESTAFPLRLSFLRYLLTGLFGFGGLTYAAAASFGLQLSRIHCRTL